MKFSNKKRFNFKFALCMVILLLLGAIMVPTGSNVSVTKPVVTGDAKEPAQELKVKSDKKTPENIPNKSEKNQKKSKDKKLNHMWISYLDFQNIPKEKIAFEQAVSAMFDRCVELGMNSVIVQVRPYSDAMYPSQYFPWSKSCAGRQGKDPGYDPTAYMIEAAHSRKLEFHAWVNPYRVTGYSMSYKEVSANNPAKIWLTDGRQDNNRWALVQDQMLYYNPSIPEVRELIVNGVKEIVEKYDVDGIHFDDYFYPTVDDNNSAKWFDKPEYITSGSKLPIHEWRRENVNTLVKEVYSTIKRVKPNVVFGVSPSGNVENLRSTTTSFVDIDTWMKEPGYVDYIMPQLYWGFECKEPNGKPAAYGYKKNLKTWINLKNKGNVKLEIGYNIGNAGMDVEDGNESSEWLRYSDILKRQVELAQKTGEVSGYAFFRYDLFQAEKAQNELYNLLPLLK